MIALLAVLALLGGPALVTVAARRVQRRARTASTRPASGAALREHVTDGEGVATVVGVALFLLGVAVLAVIAVTG